MRCRPACLAEGHNNTAGRNAWNLAFGQHMAHAALARAIAGSSSARHPLEGATRLHQQLLERKQQQMKYGEAQ